MQRFFNTTGPCNPADHYMLPPARRVPDLDDMIGRELYFVLHAARQTGKTTAMRALAAALCGKGYAAVWATLETSQGVTDTASAEPLWLASLEYGASSLPESQRPPPRAPFFGLEVGGRLTAWLRAWSQQCAAPVVLLLDEADTLSGAALVSFLRQLRAGFMDRGVGKFPVSVGLIGMRDLRDYLAQSKDGVPVNPGSPFNIKKASVTLRNFTRAEVAELYAQHTAETGQVFEPGASAAAFWWTQGQPYLVNELAGICADKLARDGRPITAADILAAKERLILSPTTHLDSLSERLKEPRVMPIIQAVLLGDVPDRIPYRSDDYQYVQDLGLIVHRADGAEPANPLYREVLARELSYDRQMSFFRPRFRWQHADGRMDFPALLDAFFDWWRENEEAILARGVKEYPEAFPHLTLMAFLQRVINGGGSVYREFSSGRGALDLVVHFQGERFPVEVKRVSPSGASAEKVRKAGIGQLAEYLDTLNERQGWLLIFNQQAEARAQPWEQRLWCEEVEVAGRRIFIRGG